MAQVNYAARGSKKHTLEAKQQKKTSSKPPKHPNKKQMSNANIVVENMREVEIIVLPMDKVAAYVTRVIVFLLSMSEFQ